MNFFERVGDPYLKINYETSMRPHYFAVRDKKTALYWMVPCSTRIEKFERILAKKRAQNKPTDTIKIVRIQGHPTALLFQDMFPISLKYIEKRYFRGGDPVFIDSERLVKEFGTKRLSCHRADSSRHKILHRRSQTRCALKS